MAHSEYVDKIIHGDLTAAYIQAVWGFHANNAKVTGVATGSDPTDAVNVQQLQSLSGEEVWVGPEPPTTDVDVWLDTNEDPYSILAITEVSVGTTAPLNPPNSGVLLWVDTTEEPPAADESRIASLEERVAMLEDQISRLLGA